MVQRLVILFLILSLSPKLVHAQQDTSNLDVSWAKDGAITGLALAGTLLMMQTNVNTNKRWGKELLPMDENVKDNFSSSAAKLSDTLVGMTIVSPLLLQVGRGFNEEAGRNALIYGQTLGVSLLVNAVAKYTVQRPRPYAYSDDPRIREYAKLQGKDAYLSFYSGHASLSFSAAVAGSYLYANQSDDDAAKTAVWGTEMALASMTSVLRVRAGKHFYSDIFLGVITGSAIGLLVPALHSKDGIYKPSGMEWGGIVGGLGLGTLAGFLLPLDSDILSPLGEKLSLRSLQAAPLALQDGGGLSLTAIFD